MLEKYYFFIEFSQIKCLQEKYSHSTGTVQIWKEMNKRARRQLKSRIEVFCWHSRYILIWKKIQVWISELRRSWTKNVVSRIMYTSSAVDCATFYGSGWRLDPSTSTKHISSLKKRWILGDFDLKWLEICYKMPSKSGFSLANRFQIILES